MSARPKRILLVQTQAENAGAQEITRLLGGGLAARGYDVHNLFFFRKSTTFTEPPNTAYCVDQRPSSPASFLSFCRALARQIRHAKPDIVLTFQHYGNILAGPIARLASAAPVVANQVSALPTMSRLVRTADYWLGMAGCFKAVTVNSLDVKRVYEAYPKPYSRRLVYVAHGFEERVSKLTPEQARREFGLPADVTLLGCVARLHPLKRLDIAIRMLPLRPAWHLALLGQGPDRERLENLASELKVADRVYFVGEVAPTRIGDFLAALDVFVFPTIAETFGLAAVEAAQAGVPVVANGLPVLREVLSVEDEPAAVFVDASSPENLAAATASVLESESLKAALRQSSQRLKSRYSVDAMVDDYERIFEQIT
ncbi:glycosyltransferase family 4 protein [Afipia sp. P52-10]|uniref:glycosyltransferase family 4 protein n=1 Tax=Afipia sp. P52-10 TaxID=1429916 RepID=UPI0004BA02CA|nr:glycosyltransferase family 4 protein [Afipia sp. P52-10]